MATAFDTGASAPTFDASTWLDDFATLGGGWIGTGERLSFIMPGALAFDLSYMLRQISGRPERIAAVRSQIAVRAGEVPA